MARKKTLSLFLALLLAVSLCACGGKSTDDSNGQQTVEAPEEKKSSEITVEALESGLADLFDDDFTHFEVTEAEGGLTFSHEEDSFHCSGKADQDRNITEVTITANSANCDLLADKDKLVETIKKLTGGQVGDMTLGELKATQAYSAVLQLYIALGADTSGSASEFMDETVAVLTDGTSLSVNGWTISAALDSGADTAVITAVLES